MANSTQPATSEFDFIIVGSGAGGGPLAARLALKGHRVLVIEAGANAAQSPRGPDLEVSQVPLLHGASTEHPDLSWRFFVKHYTHPPTGQDPKWHEPDKSAGEDDTHAGIFYPRAAALGGCTIHNALITIAGPDSDWDDLAEFLQDESWRSARMRPYFQRMENNGYLKPPTPLPTSCWGQAWYNLKWLFGIEPDHTRGRHGFKGWLQTSFTDLSLGLSDKQLLKMLKAALQQSKEAGLERAGTLVRRFLKGQTLQSLDPNHANTQKYSPEGLVLIPLAVCGPQTSLNQNRETPDVRRGRRSSPREFLLEVQKAQPDKLTIWTDCLVTKVLFEDADDGVKPRAVGVEYLKGKRLYKAHPQPSTEAGVPDQVFVQPNGEVVLCGGAFNTPQLLMLSGIGDIDKLKGIHSSEDAAEARKEGKKKKQFVCCLHNWKGEPLLDNSGDPRRIHSPGVGRNLQDRYEVTVISEMNHEFSLLKGATFRLPIEPEEADPPLQEWRERGTGLYTSNGAVLGIFKRSRPDLPQPDLFIFGVPAPFKGYEIGYSNVGDQHNFFTWTILKAHTRNHDGVVELRNSNPLETPEINFHYFNEETRKDKGAGDPDLLAIVDGVKFVRGIAEHAELVVKREYHPGSTQVTVDNEGQIKNWIRREAWGHHACGTCRMGPDGDNGAVLDHRFRVRGVDGLRVVDASIFPKIPGYFIVANIYMASEKAADVISADFDSIPAETPVYPHGLRTKEAEAIDQRRKLVPDEASAGVLAQAGDDDWPDDVTGVGISGGGIRSATLNLGILQSMAESRWLRRIDFLSTVSGGGYIGSFLGRFFDRLRSLPLVAAGDLAPQSALERVEHELSDPESPVIDWLRKHGNYIAPKGNTDWRLGIATYVRNLLSVHFVVGLLLFAIFGLANVIRYGLFDPASTGLKLVLADKGDLPLGHLLEALLGPFFSPWFVLFELLLLFLVLPRMVGYWIVSQDKHQHFQVISLTLLFVVATVLLWLGVRDGLAPPPLIIGLALFSSLIPVELAWRRGRAREEAVGTGGVETQRLRTRNYLTYDLGLVFSLAGIALVFALVDTLGHGLQQWLIENNISYAKAFAAIGVTVTALTPILRMAAGFFADKEKPVTPSTLGRIFKKQIVAGLLAVALFALPLVFYSFAAHAVFQGGSQLCAGVGATLFAILLTLIIRSPRAMTFVNRSSLAQIYSARLARAYLGASNPLRHRPDGANITEVIAADDVASIRDYKPHEAGGPVHLINVLVNQSVEFSSQRGGRDRQGENLVVSSLGMSVGKCWHSLWADPQGNDARSGAAKRPSRLEPVGFVAGDAHPLIDETGEPTNCAEMLSLRRWIGISGAAFGPGQGQNTSLGTALLFGLANVRTGYWWNSGVSEVARYDFPDLSFLRRLLFLLPEFFHTQSLLLFEWVARFAGPWEQYWNLSDGGFFENTGGYELVRRRVPRIILCDASADPLFQFESFSELVRKARIDFDASIRPFEKEELDQHVPQPVRDFVGTPDELKPVAAGPSSKHASLYWVDYETGPKRRSVLLYLKASVTADEPADITNYWDTHREFPHEATGDQVFDEAQWECYRKLGQHMASPLLAEKSWFWKIPLK